MLSSASIKAGGGAASYYEGLAKEDYYTAGGEPPGRWIGEGAERLGLSGQVQKGELSATMDGFHPHTGEALTARVGAEHKPGYDLTFSAPKSVSIAWATGDEATRKAISEAQQRAVEAAIKHAEKSGAFRTQHGHAGVEKRAYTGGLVVATFEHSTSRNGDPQLHTHAIAHNISDSGRNIDFDTKQRAELGAAYRAELAAELQKIGFEVERDKQSFRIADIPKDLEKDFSSRRQEILKELREHGTKGGKAAAAATLATREAKGEVDRQALFETARATAEKYGVTPEKINELKAAEAAHQMREMPTHEELASRLTQQASTLTPEQLRAAVYQEAQGITNLAGAREYLEQFQRSEHIIELRDSDGNTRYTSREMYDIERRLADRASAMALENTHSVRAETQQRVINDIAAKSQAAGRGNGLSDEQRNALLHITGPERISIIEGTAGAGKSYMLDAAREAWERDGYNVIGGALQGKAAEGLVDSSTIASETIHRTLHEIEKGDIKIDSKTVFVVDEAGMVDSRLMSKLQDHIDAAGAKLVLVGDTKQLQSIDAGGAMRAQRDAVGKYFEMNEIRRQHSESEKAMVHDAKAGRAAEVLAYLDKKPEHDGHGREKEKSTITEHAERDSVLKAVAEGTVADLAAGKSSVALAETRYEVQRINELAREQAKAAGVVSGEDKVFKAEIREEERELRFSAGDRVIFLKNDRETGVKNGTTGVVQLAEDGKLTVKLDGKDNAVEIDQAKYNKLDYGYAMTVHKSQGVTVDRAHYAPSSMAHREMSYVALSRHRESVKVHITEGQRQELEAQFARSQSKDTSAAYAKVEKHQGEIDRAEQRIKDADERIQKLEAQKAAQVEKTEAKPRETAADHEKLSKIDKQLAEARADRATATKDRETAQDKQDAAIAAAEAAKERAAAGKPTSEPVRMTPATAEANAQRDADLARRALDAHTRGEKLPKGKDLDKAIKRGDIRPTKDSTGRLYFENKKNGSVYAKALNQPQKRETTSRNLNHLGMTKTKYVAVDKKFLGLTVGTTVLKSGGTLGKEAAGALRDKLTSATAGRGLANAAARVATKPLDAALKKSEGWQKAGALESIAAKVQMKIEQKSAERAAVKELKQVVAKAEKPAPAADKAAEKGAAPTRTLAAPQHDLAERAERLARREPPAPAAEKSKSADYSR